MLADGGVGSHRALTCEVKPRVCFLAQMPPPVHGASLMSEMLFESPALNRAFDIRALPFQFADTTADIGKASMKKVGRLIFALAGLNRMCVEWRPTLAYFTFAPAGIALWRDLIVLAVLKIYRIRVIIHLHGRGLGADRASRVQRLCYRWAFSGATVVQLSRCLYEEIADLILAEQSRIVPNGIVDITAGLPIPERATRPGPVRVLFLSNLVPEKGVFELIEALARLRDEGVCVVGSFVGPFLSPAVERQFAQRVGRLQARASIRWEGAAYGDARLQHLFAADIFAFPSYYGPEAFPLAILEAMAAGLPVVATSVGAIPEIVDHESTGLLVPQRNVESLTTALRRLTCDSHLRLRLGEAARAKYEREYRAGRFLERMESVFAEAQDRTLDSTVTKRHAAGVLKESRR